MRNIMLSGLLIIACLPGLSQELIHVFIHDSTTYWLQEKEEQMGLVQENELVVPYQYDAVFPSLIPGFSFVLKGEAIGVFDHQSQTELILTPDYPEIALYPHDESGCYLLFKGAASGGHNILKRMRFERQADSTLEKTVENDGLQPLMVSNRIYRNGIQRVKKGHYIHHATDVQWEEVYGGDFGEEAVQYRFTKMTQQSGIYHVQQKAFITENAFATVEIWMDGHEISGADTFIDITRYGINQFLSDDWRDKVVESPESLLRYGLISPADFQMVMPPQPYRLYETMSGGIFKAVDPEEQVLQVYNHTGQLIFQLTDVKETPSEVFITNNRAYIGFYSGLYNEFEIPVPGYQIFDREGAFLKADTFFLALDYRKDDQDREIVGTLNENYSPFRWGLYDLQKSTYLLPPVYERFNRWKFSDGLLKCQAGRCTTYYVAMKDGETIYYDSELDIFEPIWAIKEPYETIIVDAFNSWADEDEDDNYTYQWHQESEAGIVTKYLGANVIANADAETQATWRDLAIIQVDGISSTPTYGLIRSGEDSFLLPPVFENMRFDPSNRLLFVELKDASGSVLLERYEN